MHEINTRNIQNPDSYRRFKSKLYRRNVKILYLLSLYMLDPVTIYRFTPKHVKKHTSWCKIHLIQKIK